VNLTAAQLIGFLRIAAQVSQLQVLGLKPALLALSKLFQSPQALFVSQLLFGAFARCPVATALLTHIPGFLLDFFSPACDRMSTNTAPDLAHQIGNRHLRMTSDHSQSPFLFFFGERRYTLCHANASGFY